MNDRLVQLYRSIWGDLIKIVPEGQGYSNPLLIKPTEEYAKADTRFVVIGQETFGWYGPIQHSPVEERIAHLQETYRRFDFGSWYRSTPFWRGAHEMREVFAPGSGARAMVWGNLNAVDKNKRRAWGIEVELARLGLLRQEIEILQPDAVVFFTGPAYDGVLHQQFPGVSFEPIGEASKRLVARLESPDLPIASFRTYHPAYLSRSKQRIPSFDAIRQAAASGAGVRPPNG